MKVIGFIASPRKNGNTSKLVKEILKGAAEKGAQTKLYHLNDLNMKGCQSCYACRKIPNCVLKDDFSSIIDEIKNAHAVVLGSPVYMWQMNSQAKTFTDRLYPFIDMELKTRFENPKPMVLAYTQGSPDSNSFQNAFDQHKNVLNFMGFDVKEILTAAGNREKDDILRNTEILSKAKSAGANLVS